MSREILSLQRYIDELLKWYVSIGNVPTWNRMFILDTTNPKVSYISGLKNGWQLPKEELRSVEEFSSRFDFMLRSGYSWINLSLYGLHEENLILGIECPSEPTGTPPGYTSVNFSGPSIDPKTGGVNWQLLLFLKSL